MKTIDVYNNRQQKTAEFLQRLLDYLIEGKKYGITVESDAIEKLKNAITRAESDLLKIAFIGGFSEGKTSIAAAWSENYDKSTMKISQAESTDEINVYDCNDYILIDTPGLFGFKENDNKVKYMDITKKYVSEADIVIYVMPSDNPIKQSHKEELVWLFKDLNLLSRTVFVLSRFDEVADIEDEEDYQNMLELKRNTVISRLYDFGIIKVGDYPSIVAVSANPYEEGIDQWLENIDDYKRVSHIGELQDATLDKIQQSGGKNAIAIKTQQSIVRDVLFATLPVAEAKVKKANHEITKLSETYNDIEKDLLKCQKKISDARIKLRTDVADYFADLIVQVEGTTLDTINSFYEKKIGSEGIMIEQYIKNKFEKQLGIINAELSNLTTKMNTSTQHYNSLIGEMAFDGLRMGGEYLKNGALVVDNQFVLKARDIILPEFKFKPWGAVKIADKLNKGIAYVGAGVGIVFELWDTYNEYKKKEAVEELKRKIVKNLEIQRKEYLEFINDNDKFVSSYFSNYYDLSRTLNELKSKVYEKESFRSDFEQWKERGDIIEAEFTEIMNY